MAVHCLRCGKTRRGQIRRPCSTPNCHGQSIPYPRNMKKVVHLYHSLGYEIESAYALHPIVPYEDGSFDETVFVCLSFARLYDDDAFPGLPPEFQILHFEPENSTRLSYYIEYYMGTDATSMAKKDTQMAINKLWKYGENIRSQGLHWVLQLGGRL